MHSYGKDILGKEKNMGIFNHRGSADAYSQGMLGGTAKSGKITPRALTLLSLTVLSTSLSLSTLIAQRGDSALIISWLTCILCATVMFLTSKKFSQAVIKILLLGLAISFFGYPMIPALIFGGVISVGAFSAIICSAKKNETLLAILLPFTSYAFSFALTADATISLLALVVYLPAVAIGLTARFKADMTTSTVSGAAVIFLIAAGGFAIILHSYYGEVSAAAINSLIGEFTQLTLAYTKESFELIGEIEYTEAIEKALILAIDTYVNVAVGLIIALCTVLAYAAIKVKNALFFAYGVDEHLSPKSTTVTVSVAASAIFSLSFVLSFALDSSNRPSLFAVICTNLCIILAPGLAVMGVRAIKAAPKRFGARGALLSIALVIATVLLFAVEPLTLPLVGAVYVILGAIDLWAKDFYGKGENQ